jgi:hypothetical protein
MDLFVCGPLFFPEVWGLITPRRLIRTNAIVNGYACLRVKAHLNPALVPLPSAIADGFLYKDVDDKIMARIDEFQGNMYQRQNVAARIETGETTVAVAHIIRSTYLPLVVKAPWNAEVFREKYLEHFVGALSQS